MASVAAGSPGRSRPGSTSRGGLEDGRASCLGLAIGRPLPPACSIVVPGHRGTAARAWRIVARAASGTPGRWMWPVIFHPRVGQHRLIRILGGRSPPEGCRCMEQAWPDPANPIAKIRTPTHRRSAGAGCSRAQGWPRWALRWAVRGSVRLEPAAGLCRMCEWPWGRYPERSAWRRWTRQGGTWSTSANALLVLEDALSNACSTTNGATTPTEKFFIRNNGQMPEPTATPDAWELTIDGEVNTPLKITLGELEEALQPVTYRLQLECGGQRPQLVHAPGHVSEPVNQRRWRQQCAEWTRRPCSRTLQRPG